MKNGFKSNIPDNELEKLLQSGWRLFLSVDLSNSTEFKNDKPADWTPVIAGFLLSFPSLLAEKIHDVCNVRGWERCKHLPALWKSSGDELIFVSQLETEHDARHILEGFKEAIRSFNDKSSLKGKGTAWIAEFPTINVALPFGFKKDSFQDYVGPMIDTGFRLGKFASPQKLVVSVELAYLLLNAKDPYRQIFYQGRETLKGVHPKSGYPIFWIFCWGEDGDTVTKLEEDLAKNNNGGDKLKEIAGNVIGSMKESSMLPMLPIKKDPTYEKSVEARKAMMQWLFQPQPESVDNKGSPDAQSFISRRVGKLRQNMKEQSSLTDAEKQNGDFRK
jgi:hypothetical protein